MARSRSSLCRKPARASRITRRRKLRCWQQDASPIARCWKANDRELGPLLLTDWPEDFLIFLFENQDPCTHSKDSIRPKDAPRTWLRGKPGRYPKQTVISAPTAECLSYSSQWLRSLWPQFQL